MRLMNDRKKRCQVTRKTRIVRRVEMGTNLIGSYNKIIASTLAASFLAGGTYAWQAFSQEVTNEVIEAAGEPGGRLHDDFDGSNKDVYIENYSSEEDGEDVYARIRLKEYMEYGPNAGELSVSGPATTILRGGIQSSGVPDIMDRNTWDVYKYGTTVSAGWKI